MLLACTTTRTTHIPLPHGPRFERSLSHTTIPTHKPLRYSLANHVPLLPPKCVASFLSHQPSPTLSQSCPTLPDRMQCIISVSYAFSRFLHSVFLSSVVMTENITSTISRYQQRLVTVPCVPATSNGRATLGEDEVANKLFVTVFVSDKNVGI